MLQLGQDAGIFGKHNLKLELFGTRRRRVKRCQAVISGSADIGIGVGTAGVMRGVPRRARRCAFAAGIYRHRRLYCM